MAFNVEAEGSGVLSESFASKTIVPGKYKLKINSIELEHKKFEASGTRAGDEGDYLYLNVETEPVEGEFEGFLIDPKDESKGRYKGQIGKVKYSRSLYKGDTRDDLISAAIMTLCRAAGLEKELKVLVGGKSATVESVIKAINARQLFKDKYVFMVVAGKEYYNKKNYINYELYLAYPKNNQLTLGSLKEEADMMEFDKASMITPVKKEPIANFGSQPIDEALSLSSDTAGVGSVDDLPF